MVRTIEQILGLPPMNQLDAAATPMASCFADQPDLAPYHGGEEQHPAGPHESAGCATSTTRASGTGPKSR